MYIVALAMAMGIVIDPEVVAEAKQLAQFPALGWYLCKPEYAQIYCTVYEMQE